MSTELIGALGLVLIFLIGTVSSVNLGALALVASFVVGMGLAGESLETVLTGFPPSMFLTLFGVTYLFGIATGNGTVEWLVDSCTRLVRGNRVMLPLLVFVIAAVPTALGAAGPAIVAIIVPLAIRIALQNRLSPYLLGLLVVHGTTAGGFSPINLGGVILNGTLERGGIDTSPMVIFASSFAYNLALGVVLFLVFGGRQIWRDRHEAAGVDDSQGGAAAGPTSGTGTGSVATATTTATEVRRESLDLARTLTLVAFLALAVLSIAFDLDVGMLAVCEAVLLQLVFPTSSGNALAKVAWEVVLLICGILTYVATLERIGTVDMLGDSIGKLDSPLVAALLVLVVAGLVSAFASTFGTIGAMVPLSLPLLATGEIGVVGLAIALAISSSVVDSSPFSTNGALLVAATPKDRQAEAYRILLMWGAAMVLTAPVATWLIFVVA